MCCYMIYVDDIECVYYSFFVVIILRVESV